jgi:hypothetical protein
MEATMTLRCGLVLVLVTAVAACGKKTPAAPPEAGVATGQGEPDAGKAPAVDRATALAAFETVRAVFQHPRCQNCHPAGEVPLQGDDGHEHQQYVQRGPYGRGVVGAECTTCHGLVNLPESYGPNMPPGIATGWRMPSPDEPLVFAGLAPGALCEQVKDPARNGGKDMTALRHHLEDPLVTWAWAPGAGRAPIPIAREAFLEAWARWEGAGAPCP